MDEKKVWQERFEVWMKPPNRWSDGDQVIALVVTEWLKPVFGEILKSAATFYDKHGPYHRKRKDRIATKEELCVDGYPLFLEFANGRIVKFSTSEWAWIESVEPKDS